MDDYSTFEPEHSSLPEAQPELASESYTIVGGDSLFPEDVTIIEPPLAEPPAADSGYAIVGGDPLSPGDVTVVEPALPERSAADSGYTIVGGDGLPSSPADARNPIEALTIAADTLNRDQAAEFWHQVLPGQPLPTQPDGSPLTPEQTYLEMLNYTADPAVVHAIQGGIESIEGQTSNIIDTGDTGYPG